MSTSFALIIASFLTGAVLSWCICRFTAVGQSANIKAKNKGSSVASVLRQQKQQQQERQQPQQQQRHQQPQQSLRAVSAPARPTVSHPQGSNGGASRQNSGGKISSSSNNNSRHNNSGSNHKQSSRTGGGHTHADEVRMLEQGCYMLKFHKHSRVKPRVCHVTCDVRSGILTWGTHDKSRLRLDDVTDIVRGARTDVFRDSGNSKHIAHRQWCFSIVTPTRTLDLQASNEVEGELWIRQLTRLTIGGGSSSGDGGGGGEDVQSLSSVASSDVAPPLDWGPPLTVTPAHLVEGRDVHADDINSIITQRDVDGVRAMRARADVVQRVEKSYAYSKQLWPGDIEFVLLKFVRACKYDIDAAAAQFEDMMQYRDAERVDEIMDRDSPDDEVLQTLMPYAFHGIDKAGRLVYYEKTGVMHIDAVVARFNQNDFVYLHTRWMENVSRLIRERNAECTTNRVSRFHFVMDVAGMSLAVRKIIPWLQGIKKIDADYNPEQIYRISIVNAPAIFSFVFALARPFLDETTAQKVHIYRAGTSAFADAFLPTIELSQVPVEYGGTCVCEGGCIPRDHRNVEYAGVVLADIFGEDQWRQHFRGDPATLVDA